MIRICNEISPRSSPSLVRTRPTNVDEEQPILHRDDREIQQGYLARIDRSSAMPHCVSKPLPTHHRPDFERCDPHRPEFCTTSLQHVFSPKPRKSRNESVCIYPASHSLVQSKLDRQIPQIRFLDILYGSRGCFLFLTFGERLGRELVLEPDLPFIIGLLCEIGRGIDVSEENTTGCRRRRRDGQA